MAYWLIHFANFYRARQVYNNILHQNSSAQAHFGRSGLNMLAYDPTHEAGTLYLFDQSGRESAKGQLLEDIPRLISESGDVIGVWGFYESIYNAILAHTDDVHTAIINLDIEVITPAGGETPEGKHHQRKRCSEAQNSEKFLPDVLERFQIHVTKLSILTRNHLGHVGARL